MARTAIHGIRLGRTIHWLAGSPERNWLTREHRDIPQPNQENTHRPVDPLRRQSTGDSGRERLAQIAEKFVRKAAALVTLGQIPVTQPKCCFMIGYIPMEN